MQYQSKAMEQVGWVGDGGVLLAHGGAGCCRTGRHDGGPPGRPGWQVLPFGQLYKSSSTVLLELEVPTWAAWGEGVVLQGWVTWGMEEPVLPYKQMWPVGGHPCQVHASGAGLRSSYGASNGVAVLFILSTPL